MTETANTTLRQVHILGIEATDKRHPEGETHSASRYVATLAIVPPIEREVLQADMDEVRMTLSRQGTSPINPRIMGSRPVMLPTNGGEETGEVRGYSGLVFVSCCQRKFIRSVYDRIRPRCRIS